MKATKLHGKCTLVDAVVILSGNSMECPKVLGELMAASCIHDPESITGVVGPLITLDELGIYGFDVVTLSAKCADPYKLLLLIKAHTLGLVSKQQMLEYTRESSAGPLPSDFRLFELKVKTMLPQFSARTNGNKPLLEVAGRPDVE